MLFGLGLVLLSLGLASARPMDPITEALIDTSIRSYFLEERHIPGFGLTIVSDGEIIYSKGFGDRNFERNETVTNSSLFGLGSVTKIITSTMMVKVLMEKFPELGGGVIDTPIAKLAPPEANFTFIDKYRTETISFRDILSHRHCTGQTGLSLFVGSIPTSQEFMYRQRYIGQTGSFRSGCFSYSNEVYGFAGQALEVVMNDTFSNMAIKFMREVGMIDAIVIDKEGSYENDPNLNTGYYWREDLQENHPFNRTLWRKIHLAQGGGAIMASPRDMGAFLKFHVNRGFVDGTELMRMDQLNIVYDVAERLGFGGDKNSDTDLVTGNLGYGLGITVSLFDGWKMYQHAGNFPPFRNKISFSHKQNLGIYSTSNSMSINEGDMDYAHLMIAELFKKNVTMKGYENIPSEVAEKLANGEIGLPRADFDYLINFPDSDIKINLNKPM